MFLFTDAPVGTRDTGASAGGRATAAGAAGTAERSGAVIDAIRDGAQSSGVGFDYLLATAQRESGLDPKAKAATSSASGLYQFIEQTWLGTMKAAGSRLGLSGYADAITARADGRYDVSDTATRQAILDLRSDPRVAAAMAGALTQRNRDALSTALGREPTSGDLYAAHVLGAKGAATLINSAQGSPARPAALDLPEAAGANRGLFYDRNGRARSSSELYALLSTSTAGGKPAVAGTATDPAATAVGLPQATTAYAALDTGLRSLFQTDRRQGSLVQGATQTSRQGGQATDRAAGQGAVSAGVARLWQNRTPATTGTDGGGGASYFPRSDSSPDTVREPETTGSLAAAASDATAPAKTVVVPLPPPRPAAFARSAASAAGATATDPSSTARSAALVDFSSYALRNGP